MKTAARNQVAVAACSFELDPARAGELQLTPAGVFRARDGRPAGLPGWRMDAAAAARLTARFAARHTPTVIDYEHQTLLAEQNGKPAPAAGWFRQVEWRDGQGLFAAGIEWTTEAARMIAAREYRYSSPVLVFDRKTGEVLDIQMASLTNFPAIDGLSELQLRAAAKFESTDQETDMNPILLALLKGLGLAEDTTEAQATAALKALQNQVTTQTTEITALKAATPDPSKYVPIEAMKALQADIAALKAADTGREVDLVVKAALTDGRLLPAMESWARELGAKDIAALRAYVEAAQPIAALGGTQTSGKQPGGEDGALSEADLAICKQLGLTPDEYKKANAKAA